VVPGPVRRVTRSIGLNKGYVPRVCLVHPNGKLTPGFLYATQLHFHKLILCISDRGYMAVVCTDGQSACTYMY
jgi:hypothetical protein